MHLVKEFNFKNLSINLLQYTYPVQMALDIYASDTNLVIVGIDKHIEFYDYIKHKVQSYLNKDCEFHNIKSILVNTLYGIDGKKMSKSYENYISIFSDINTLKKRINSIVTIDKNILDINDYENNS
jgi:tryptophanyl-tRNA synthetase